MITDPDKLKKIYEEKVCIICGIKYLVPRTRRRGKRPAGIRPRNAKTCATKCSKKYNRSHGNTKSI